MEYMGKYYFASDFHLGAGDALSSKKREREIVEWLHRVSIDAEAIFLVGDIFDFWFEYNKVIPKGFTLFLAKIQEITEKGIKVYFFPGNHDMWMFDYLEEEIGVEIVKSQRLFFLNGIKCYIHHGDGLGKGDFKYKILKAFFASSLCQFLFKWLHPDIGMWIAHKWSSKSRISHGNEELFQGNDKEWLYQFSIEQHQIDNEIELFIFGHRHLTLDIPLPNSPARYINLGEWLNAKTYGVLDGTKFELMENNSDSKL